MYIIILSDIKILNCWHYIYHWKSNFFSWDFLTTGAPYILAGLYFWTGLAGVAFLAEEKKTKIKFFTNNIQYWKQIWKLWVVFFLISCEIYNSGFLTCWGLWDPWRWGQFSRKFLSMHHSVAKLISNHLKKWRCKSDKLKHTIPLWEKIHDFPICIMATFTSICHVHVCQYQFDIKLS